MTTDIATGRRHLHLWKLNLKYIIFCTLQYPESPVLLTQFACGGFPDTCGQQVGCTALLMNSEVPRTCLSVQRWLGLVTANYIHVQKSKHT